MNTLPTMVKTQVESVRTRPLTEAQENFLALAMKYNLDFKRAYEDTDYKYQYSALMYQLKDEVLALTETLLASEAPQSVKKIIEIRDSDEAIPNAATKLDASKTILDRVGLGKREKLEVDNKVSGGLFIIPAKEV